MQISGAGSVFLNPDIVHLGLAVLFLSFLLGSLEAIEYLFSTTVDQLILKQKLSRLAHRDPLTNLFNRLMLSESIEIAFKNLSTEHTKLALHIIDLAFQGIVSDVEQVVTKNEPHSNTKNELRHGKDY